MRLCIEFVIVSSNFDCCIYVLSHPGYPFPLASPPTAGCWHAKIRRGCCFRLGGPRGQPLALPGFVLGSCGIGRVLDVLDAWFSRIIMVYNNGIYHYNYDVLFQVFLQRKIVNDCERLAAGAKWCELHQIYRWQRGCPMLPTPNKMFAGQKRRRRWRQ